MKKIFNEMKRMQELAGILSEAKVEGGELESKIREFEMLHDKFKEAKRHFESIEAEFRVAEDVVRTALESLDEAEDKVLELEDLTVRIKVKGSEKTTYPYKLIAETLYSKVNATLKSLIDELMQKESKVHQVKSSIELKRRQVDESLSFSDMMSKAGEFVTGLFSKLGDFLKGTNSKLQSYIDQLRNVADGRVDGEEELTPLTEDINTESDIVNRLEAVKADIKKMSRPMDARNEMFQADPAMAPKVQKEIEAIMNEFMNSPKTSEWQFFEKYKSNPEELAKFKREYVFNEIDNRISNFFFNSGSGSFVRMFANPYKIQVVQEMKKVADALKLARLSRGLQGAIDAYKRDYKPEESAIDKLRAQAGIQPKNVTSESKSKKISMTELKKMVEDAVNEMRKK